MPDVEIIFTVEEAPEGGYTASALEYAIHTQADSLPELREMARDAVRCHFEDGEGPSVIRLSL
jgi:predicted RNase H-like HicB family nuclease